MLGENLWLHYMIGQPLYSSRYNGLDKIITTILSNIGVVETNIDTYSNRFRILHLYHQKALENSFASTKSSCLQLWDYEKTTLFFQVKSANIRD